jgi:hypothetical protein
MARSYAKVYRDIWGDRDFTSQPAAVQYLYLFLLSQPNLNAAGVLPLTIRRWASVAGRGKPENIEADLASLEARKYVLMDYDTEELLVRTYIRNDGLWRIPNTLYAVVRDAERTVSSTLRSALAGELRALPVDNLEGKRAREMKAQVTTVVATLSRTVAPSQGCG